MLFAVVVAVTFDTRIGVNGTFDIVIGGFGDIGGFVTELDDVIIGLDEFVVTMEISLSLS